MASALASQLQALAVAAGQPTNINTKTKASLIFSPSQAADIDLRTIFDLCEAGLEELAGMDKRFVAYKKTLFSPETIKLDRELQSRELNDKLNSSISTFLRLLSNYIMLKPAHQILEYLIRRYKIHVFNVDEILISALPYHETSLFVRILQLLQLKKTKWAFLVGFQEKGAAPTRAALVNQCRSDAGLLDTLCEAAIKVARMPSKTRTIASFTSIVVMELLAAVPSVETRTVNKILPFILHSFEGGITEDFRVGALMVVGTLANRTSLSSSLVEILTVAMAKAIQKESAVEGAPLIRVSLMVMIQLMQTQAIDHFPVEAFKVLVKLRVFYELLAKLTVMYDASRLLTLFLEVHVKHCATHVNYEQSLVSMINTVPLKDFVGQLVTSILQLYMGNNGIENGEQRNCKEVAKHLFQVLERRFPTELDSAVSSCLQNGPESGKSAKGSAEQEALHEIFVGTLHVPLLESNRTLFSSLDHPEARIREAAVRQLADLENAPNSSLHAEVKDIMWEALFQRASDDDYSVLHAILSIKNLVSFPFPERVFKMLTSIIFKSINTITADGKVNVHAAATASLALKLLASEFLSLHPSFAERVAAMLFGLLLASPKTLSLNLVALKLAGKVPFALYAAIPEFPDLVPEQDGGVKYQKEELLLLVNEKVVSSLATCVLKKSENLLPVLFSCATESPRSNCLALAVLLRIFQEAPKDCVMDVVKASPPWLREQLTVLESEKAFNFKNATKEDYEASRIRVVAYELLDVKPVQLHADLLLRTFYQLLEVVPISSTDKPIGSNDLLKRLYELFASAHVGDKFSPHLKLLLKRLSDEVFSFLSGYFILADFEASPHLHSHSLDLLASYYSQLSTSTAKEGFKLKKTTVDQLQVALPILVVGLASPVQKVRRSAAECLEQLHVLSEKHLSISSGEVKKEAKNLPTEVLSPNTFEKVVKTLVEAKTACTSNEHYVATVLENLLSGTESETLSSTKALRLKPMESKAVVNFFTAHALGLSAVAQRIIFSVLKGTGYEVELLGAGTGTMEQLLERRARHHLHTSPVSDVDKLSPAEVDLLDILLQMYTPKAVTILTAGPNAQKQPLSHLLESLKVEGGSTSDPAVVKPCIASLGCLTSEFFKRIPVSVQEEVFQALVELSSSTSADIHAPTQAVLRNIIVPAKVIAAYLGRLGMQSQVIEESPAKKKRRVKSVKTGDVMPFWSTPQQQVSCTAALLEVMAWLPNIEDRQELVAPLYQLLKFSESEIWPLPISDLVSTPACERELMPNISLDYIQQLIFINLERLATSILSDTNPDHAELFNIDILVQCVADTSDTTTRNQTLMLLTAIARVFPQKVLSRIVDIFSVIGESTLSQDDKYSHDVTQQLLVVVVPFWLETTKDPTALLQVIVIALPQVPIHRRMSLVTTLLRVMKEKDSLHIFLMLLLNGTTRQGVLEENGEDSRDLHIWKDHWEVKFAKDLCQEYAPNVWLPALVKLLKATSANTSPAASQFITYQLQGLHVYDKVHIPQEAFVALLGQVVIQLHSGRKENQFSLVALLDCLTLVLAPITYLEGLIKLLKTPDNNIRRKVLLLYSARMKMQDEAGEHPHRSNKGEQKLTDKSTLKKEHELQERMVSQISAILLAPTEDGSTSVKLAALEALERCATRLANTNRAGSLVNILAAVVSVLNAKKKALCVTGVRCVGTLVSILGPRALPSLPGISTQLFILGRDAMSNSSYTEEAKESSANAGPEIIVSVLKTLGVIVENLGAFLNPYLGDMISFLVLQPSVIKAPDAIVTGNAATLRVLISEKIPARLLLDPLIGAYEQSLSIGSEATSALFHMVAAVTSRMDRSSVPLYHVKIFNVCLRALDLRSSRPSNFAIIGGVEESVIEALASLVLKLSENTFKPLFVSLLDWAQTSSMENGLSGNQLHRRIAFFGLVHRLLEKLRSLFVPYFSYLLDVCVSTLTDGQAVGGSDPAKPKKKKKKASDGDFSVGLSLASWHLRQLVLSSLHKCFLYDTVGFLDSAKFQQLLAPVVSQLLVDAPPGLLSSQEVYGKIASVEEMDDTVVSCVSQMALTAGSDLFWKPLNREVLMCTRNKQMRARLLALRVVKLLAEHLKEEYLVLLPETLPFLAELLEDSELVVVANSQEIIKILETNSGESLSQYF